MGEKTNYALKMREIMQEVPQGTPLLLHACCAPCLSGVLPQLNGHFAPLVYYYNPNTAPYAEYEKRLHAVRQLLDVMPEAKDANLVCGEYDEEKFAALAQGLEEEAEGASRCARCIALRIKETARKAAELGIEWFTTTLSVSPHKNAAMINELGEQAAKNYGVRFLHSDFKKNDGFKKSIQLSGQYNIYRQNYCGCVFSVK